ncbi:MAG: hypothetical protein MZV64_60930 [Ignavibacteriales bacterium]|nr:hypothetical protein [Ignavibacteriales bacterium]
MDSKSLGEVLMQNFFNQIYYGNSIAAYLTALGIFIVGTLVIKIFKNNPQALKKWAQNTETTLDDFLKEELKDNSSASLFSFFFHFILHKTI